MSLKLITERNKPRFGLPCNGCGYCCAVQPCALAEEVLGCSEGPCVALEVRDGESACGLVVNPLGYLWKVAHPGQEVAELSDMPQAAELRASFIAALGVGRGCDSADDEVGDQWPFPVAYPQSW